MTAATTALTFDGQLLRRGFWLYVWEIIPPSGPRKYYVGRTGDSSSVNAQSPFNRMGQHLGYNPHDNVLRRRLVAAGLSPEACTFRLVAHGPVGAEETSTAAHHARRDVVAAMESHLAQVMAEAGYDVLNHPIACSKPLDAIAFASVRASLAAHFDQLPAAGDAP